jgi:hypothetical protein
MRTREGILKFGMLKFSTFSLQDELVDSSVTHQRPFAWRIARGTTGAGPPVADERGPS